MVLCLLPIWLGILVAGVPFLWGYWTGEVAFDTSALNRWEGRVLLVSLLLLALHEILLWRGRLGVVNREVMRSTQDNRFIAMLGVRRLTFRWSVALWQGLFLGCLDALLGRNGHKR
jgi:hypothetical protein